MLFGSMIRNKAAYQQQYSLNKDMITNEITQIPVTSGEHLESHTMENTSAEYVYDKLNRLIKVIYSDGSMITYSYDKNGNMKASKVSAVITPTPVVTEMPTPEVTEMPTPGITTTPYHGNIVEVYYANAGWTTAYIHYKVGNGSWTSVPGKRMSVSTDQTGYTWKYTIDLGNASEVTVCFNNGNGIWDSRNESNYKVYAGIYGIKEQKVTELHKTTSVPEVTVTPYVGNTAEVYYYNAGWTTAYIHYKVGNGSWTSVPGKQMSTSSEQAGYTWKYIIELGNAAEAEVCFNNGNGSWDSKDEANYKLSGAGVYGVKNGAIAVLR